MASGSPHADRLAAVEAAFRTLPERYLGAEAGFDATYHVKLGDLGHTWEVRCTSHNARVCKGATRREPDVTLSTTAATSAQQVTIDRCGHVPQVERPDETNELLMSFFARADAMATDRPAADLDAEAA